MGTPVSPECKVEQCPHFGKVHPHKVYRAWNNGRATLSSWMVSGPEGVVGSILTEDEAEKMAERLNKVAEKRKAA